MTPDYHEVSGVIYIFHFRLYTIKYEIRVLYKNTSLHNYGISQSLCVSSVGHNTHSPSVTPD